MGLTSATPHTTSFNNQHLPYLMNCFFYCVIMIIAKGVSESRTGPHDLICCSTVSPLDGDVHLSKQFQLHCFSVNTPTCATVWPYFNKCCLNANSLFTACSVTVFSLSQLCLLKAKQMIHYCHQQHCDGNRYMTMT